ncbi:peptidoglycan-binding protein, partial [Cohaesibacter celericrescens]|uniref:peptidoglycan-binding protein n=1 Tax=Cohaesibacter celericrescens TaxID=2067669 RepID=UPI0035662BFD
PDAVVKGVDYKQLNAEKIIAACNEALADYPSEARFYTQLTRGLHKAGKLNEAFDATKKGADLGSAHSMAYLAVMYKLGEPIAKDLKKSLFWFEKAAENGNPGGMIFAAAMYRDGTGTPRDYKRAAKLYQQASDLDIAEAMSSLAVFYDRGQGVEKSPESAASYLLKALLGDDKQAQQLLFEASGAISKETRQNIQTTLQKEGFYKGKIDGDFGSRTRQALTRYRSGRKGG